MGLLIRKVSKELVGIKELSKEIEKLKEKLS